MRARTLLITSLGLNLVLLVGWFWPGEMSHPLPPEPPGNFKPEPVETKTRIFVRRENFTWDQIESTNFVTYISKLRSIGCPAQTIRDIIVADVNQMFSRRRAREVVSPDQQWWRSDPDLRTVTAAADQIRRLEAERKNLLTRLLGPKWETVSGVPPAGIGISLTGPILGDLPEETKQAVYDIIAKSKQRIEDYQEAQRQQNKPVDPVELARIRQQSRQELLQVFTPDQDEEYLLRYSQTARQLREQMRGLELSPNEFRSLFRAVDPIVTDPDYYYAGNDPELVKRQQDLQARNDAALQYQLGSGLYDAYKLNQDPVYQSAKVTAQQLVISQDYVMALYAINHATQVEMDRIRNDNTMTSEEKVEALAQTQVDQQQSLELVLGPEVFQRWLKNQPQ